MKTSEKGLQLTDAGREVLRLQDQLAEVGKTLLAADAKIKALEADAARRSAVPAPLASKGEYPKRIPRARAEAALDLANAILDLEDDLLQLEQPGDLNEGMEDGTTTVERDVWLEWVALAKKAVCRG